MSSLLLQCLTPLFVLFALLGAVVVSVEKWPDLWPASVRDWVRAAKTRVGVQTGRVRAWFAPKRGDALDPIQLHIRQARIRYGEWVGRPSNRVTRNVGIGAAVALTAGVVGLFMQEGSLWNRAAIPVIASTAVVFLVDYLHRRRTELLEKERIIRAMGSRSNHVALDAARVVIERQWHRDGSLSGAVFEQADLRGIRMARARLGGSSFMYAKLEDAELMFADFADSRLGSSNLRSANLSFSNLQNAALGLANLENASLGRCSLRSAHLEGANLCDAFLEHADLTGAHFEQAIYNAKTRWPEGFTPPPEAINWDTLSDTERDWFRQWRWYLA